MRSDKSWYRFYKSGTKGKHLPERQPHEVIFRPPLYPRPSDPSLFTAVRTCSRDITKAHIRVQSAQYLRYRHRQGIGSLKILFRPHPHRADTQTEKTGIVSAELT